MKFYNVEELCVEKIEHIKRILQKSPFYNVGAMYRLFVSQLLPPELEKIIYLDSDIIINLDLSELWKIEIGDKVLAAVPEIFNRNNLQEDLDFPLCQDGVVKNDCYFNSGVLPMNLTLFRKEKNILSNWLTVIEKNPQYGKFADQDSLNYYFSTRTLKLPLKFNRFVVYEREEQELILDKKIYHFAGGHLNLNLNDPFNRLWMDYFMKTPWFDAETIGRLYDSYRQMNIALKSSMANISAVMSGKTRVFFTLPQNVEAIKEIFSIRNDEEIILAEDQESLQKLIDAMKCSQDKRVFFILVPNFPFGILIQAGFVYGKDFLNGFDFLSEANGIPLNSYELIKAM